MQIRRVLPSEKTANPLIMSGSLDISFDLPAIRRYLSFVSTERVRRKGNSLMRTARFRDTPKERLQVMIPAALVEEIRRRSFAERRPENAIASDLLCRGSGIDPATFGLGPDPALSSSLSHSPADGLN
jgi:hypothetical protein